MGRVLAKFKVQEVAEIAGWQPEIPVLKRIKLSAVRGEPFGSATPNGTIDMVVANPVAAELFHVGKEYFVTFEEDAGEQTS